MSTERILKSACGLCNAACGVLIHIQDGKPVRVEGNPDDPANRGALCPKGRASLDILYHPDRLKYPLKRMGKRGEGKWERISWDEALNTIAGKLNETKDKFGPESVAMVFGAYKGGVIEGLMIRMAAAFGTPNMVRTASICNAPRTMASRVTYAFLAFPDYDYPPSCIMMWGVSSSETHLPNFRHAMEALKKGSKLIVIDPRETEFSKRADIWIKPRPCSDLALALGMLNVIINEGLFDKDFVGNWTVGFDRLKAHVQDYFPEKVEEITWVPASTIRAAARLYATTKPACIPWGNGLDNNINNFQSGRAICCLRAVTGNLQVPGSDIRRAPSGAIALHEKSTALLKEMLPEDIRQKRISAGDRLLPIFPFSTAQQLVHAILEEEPYPIHAMYLMGYSLLHTHSNARETRKALEKLDFWATAELFMTPTSSLADIVLPAASYLEEDSVYRPEPTASSETQIQQKSFQIGECWPSQKILLQLAGKLGLSKEIPWRGEKELLDYIVSPSGLTFEDAKRTEATPGIKQYRFYQANGFETPSGKVELYSSQLEKWGFEPLPAYHEPPETPYSEPELDREYPLIFTNWKNPVYQHSQGRQVASLRNHRPDPVVELHPETAGKLGIKEGDWVYIETKRGRIRQRARFAPNIDPRVIFVDFGWWFPEKASSGYGWAESNINILTSNKKPYSREMGSATLRGIFCKVYKEDGETD